MGRDVLLAVWVDGVVDGVVVGVAPVERTMGVANPASLTNAIWSSVMPCAWKEADSAPLFPAAWRLASTAAGSPLTVHSTLTASVASFRRREL